MQILIADPSPLCRLGVEHLLASRVAGAKTIQAGTFPEMMDRLRRAPYDVLIMDLAMPGMTGLEALRQVKREFPALPVLILSDHSEQSYAVRVFRAGANSYLTKDTDLAELVTAVEKVRAAGNYVSAAVGEILALSLGTRDHPLHYSLSDREYEVLCLFGAGKTVGEIAEAIHLSVTTVSTYRSRILEKMQMSTTAELIRYAIAHQLSPEISNSVMGRSPSPALGGRTGDERFSKQKTRRAG